MYGVKVTKEVPNTTGGVTMTTAAPAKLPELDVKQIEAQERLAVAERMLAATTPEALLRLASLIVDEANQAAPKDVRDRRDTAALHLSLYDGVKAVYKAVGLSRAFFHGKRIEALGLTDEEKGSWLAEASKEDVARRAAEKGVPRVEDAEQTALELADRIVRADARAKVARAFRDEAVVQLHEKGWSRHQIAEVGGFDDSRVSQIRGTSVKRRKPSTGAS